MYLCVNRTIISIGLTPSVPYHLCIIPKLFVKLRRHLTIGDHPDARKYEEDLSKWYKQKKENLPWLTDTNLGKNQLKKLEAAKAA